MRDYLNYKYKIIYSEQFRLPSIKFLLKLFSNKKSLSKNDLTSKCIPSSYFNSKLTLEKSIRMMNYYGLINKNKENYQLTEFGIVAKYSTQYKTENEFLEILNYSSYVNNLTYHLIIDLLFNISEKEISGSIDFFSQMSSEEQYTYIQNKIEESVQKNLHKRYIRHFTHPIRKMGIVDKFGFMPRLRNNLWKGIFLISFSDVLKENKKSNNEILLTDTLIKDIIAPLFLTKDAFYSFLNRETLHPYFKLNITKGKEYYIQINKIVTPLTIVEENL